MTILTFQNFSKRRNSTKAPLDSAGTSRTVHLKDGTSLEVPVFELASNDFTINYVKAFGTYYFVNDIVSTAQGILELHCQKDVLATFKSDIGSYTAFVERAASSYDLMLHDAAISQDQEYIQKAEGARTTLLASVVHQGAYIIRTIGWNGINSFLATEDDIKNILSYAYSQTTYTNDWVQFFVDNVAAAFADPFKFILDLRWIGLTASQITDLGGRPSRRVYLGYFDTGIDLHKVDAISAYYPTTLEYQTQVAVAVPTAYYNDFRDYDPAWAEYQIYIPGCGYHPLDPVSVQNGISLDFAIDVLTGDIVAQVYAGTTDPSRIMLFETKGSGGCPIQIGQFSAQGSGSILSSLGSKVNFAEMATNVIDLPINSAVSALVGDTPSVIGSVGSRGCIQFNPDAFITKKLLKAKDFQTATSGRPLCKNVQLSTLSGFVKCAGASLDIAGEAGDKDAVNAFLNGGFYYE